MRGQAKLIVALSLILALTISCLGWTLLKNYELENEIVNLRSQISFLKDQVGLLKKAVNLSVTAPHIIRINNTYASIYYKAKNSVVVVYGFIKKTVLTIFGPATSYERVQGSGFVILFNHSYYVITNHHVVNDVMNITLVFSDGEAFRADLIGSDPYSDLAVLKPYVPEEKLIPLNITSSSTLKVGDVVLALGNPFGLQGSLTEGVVSQIGRSIRTELTGGYLIPDVIQFDAPINPGNSGGPLLNIRGEVVGITTAIVSGAQGIGFAIPSDTILRELPYLIKYGYYDLHPWLGIRGIDMSYEIAQAMGINYTYGWLIVDVIRGGPAFKAGLRGGNKEVVIAGEKCIIGGDLIIAVDGVRVRNSDDLTTYIERNKLPGDSVTLTIVRNGKVMNVDLVLGKRPPLH